MENKGRQGTDVLRTGIREAEEAFFRLFSQGRPFSAHLYKWQDDRLPDMYDHNAFFACGSVDAAEIDAAAAYQRQRGLDFLKIESRSPLSAELVKRFGLAEEVTDTMLLQGGSPDTWKPNRDVTVRDMAAQTVESDILEIELRNYGHVYGEDFVRRRVRRYAETVADAGSLHYFGAYLDGRIAGACHAFVTEKYVGLDGLIVDEQVRCRYVATTLLRHVIEAFAKPAYLHADASDTPRQMYARMGFVFVDVKYEYNYRRDT